VATNARLLCIEFCNIVQWHAFVNYFIVIKFNMTVFNWYGIILKPQFHFVIIVSEVF
jgi:hypothetical protein